MTGPPTAAVILPAWTAAQQIDEYGSYSSVPLTFVGGFAEAAAAGQVALFVWPSAERVGKSE